jgi:hypothetical protein
MSQIFQLRLVIFGEYRIERALFLSDIITYVYLFVVGRADSSTSKDSESCAVATPKTFHAGGAWREKSDYEATHRPSEMLGECDGLSDPPLKSIVDCSSV